LEREKFVESAEIT